MNNNRLEIDDFFTLTQSRHTSSSCTSKMQEWCFNNIKNRDVQITILIIGIFNENGKVNAIIFGINNSISEIKIN